MGHGFHFHRMVEKYFLQKNGHLPHAFSHPWFKIPAGTGLYWPVCSGTSLYPYQYGSIYIKKNTGPKSQNRSRYIENTCRYFESIHSKKSILKVPAGILKVRVKRL